MKKKMTQVVIMDQIEWNKFVSVNWSIKTYMLLNLPNNVSRARWLEQSGPLIERTKKKKIVLPKMPN